MLCIDRLVCVLLLISAGADSDDLQPLRIATPTDGHIHPAFCVSKQGTLIVTYGQVNHRDLRITRSTDAGKSWSAPAPFPLTEKKTYYPGSLTTLENGQSSTRGTGGTVKRMKRNLDPSFIRSLPMRA